MLCRAAQWAQGMPAACWCMGMVPLLARSIISLPTEDLPADDLPADDLQTPQLERLTMLSSMVAAYMEGCWAGAVRH